MMIRSVIIAVWIVLATGCSLTPPVPDMSVETNTAWQTQEKVTNAEPLTEWWRTFNDPVLNDLIDRAVANNQDLKIAQARVREARAGVRIGKADQYSQIDLRTAAGRRKDELQGDRFGREFRQVDFYEAGFDASWEVDLFGGNEAEAHAAEADYLAAVYAYRDVMVSLLAEVARNYIRLRGAQERLDVAENNIELQQAALELLRSRAKAGVSSELDVSKAETELQSLQARVPALQSRTKRSEYRLATLLGRRPGTLESVLKKAGGLPPLPERIPVGLPSDLLERRPDIRRAQAEVLAANARVGAAKADLFPKFFISGAFVRTSEDSGSISFGPGSIYSFGPVITLPLLDGGRIRANIDVQDARLEQQLARCEQTVLRSLEDVESALTAWSREQERKAKLREAVDSAVLSESLARDLYRQGLEDYFAVLDAQRSKFTTEDELAVSRTEAGLNLVALYKSLGGGWRGELTAGRSR